MAKISGASSLMRFARTTPQWQNATRRVWNPASVSWQQPATTAGNSYLMEAVDVNLVFPNVPAGYNFAISFWFLPRTYGAGERGLMQLEDAGGLDQISLSLDGTSNQIRIVWAANAATAELSTGLIGLNNWNHVLFQMQDNNWTINVNGVSNTGATPAIPDFALISKWRLGRSVHTPASGAETFNGLMSDIMVAQSYLNFTQQTVLYNAGAAFNMAQSIIAPLNPALDTMTFLCDGTKTGVMLFLGVSRLTSASISPQIQRQASFAWSGNLQNVPALDAVSRPAAKSNTYQRLAELAQGWDNNLARTTFQGTIVKPMPTGQSISVNAPALLAWPFSGWGFVTDSSSFVGAVNAPQATPQLTVSGTLLERGTDTNPVVGSGTFQHALDTREVRYLRPTFSKRV